MQSLYGYMGTSEHASVECHELLSRNCTMQNEVGHKVEGLMRCGLMCWQQGGSATRIAIQGPAAPSSHLFCQ